MLLHRLCKPGCATGFCFRTTLIKNNSHVCLLQRRFKAFIQVDDDDVKIPCVFRPVQDILMNLAKAVANAAAMLVLKAKNVAQVAEDTVLQNRVIAAATQCALSTSQLVACAKVQEFVCRMFR